MLYGFLVVVLVLAALVTVISILMQAGKGGGLAANFGGAGSSSDAFMGSRQASTFITKTSWIAGALFLALSYILSLSGTRAAAPKSVLEGIRTPASAAPPPVPIGGAIPGQLLNPAGSAGSGTTDTSGKLPPP
jgi:preprotein translocase subunit SecG